MPDEFNQWETSSGLLDEYESIKVVEAVFAYDEQYRKGEELRLELSILTTDPENGEGGVVVEKYSLGSGWTTTDRGATIVHESGNPKKFNNNSGIGLLADSLVGVLSLDECAALGDPKDADTWRKLGAFNWKRKGFEMTPPEGGEKVKYTRMLIESRVEGGAATAAAPAASTSVPSAAEASAAIDAAAAAGGGEGASYDVPPVLKVKLAKFAREADTHDAFAEKAFALEGVADVTAMEELCADEKFYLWLKG